MQQIKAKKTTIILQDRVKALRARLPKRFKYAEKVKAYCDEKEIGVLTLSQCYQMTRGNHTPTPVFIKGLTGVVKEYEKEIAQSFK